MRVTQAWLDEHYGITSADKQPQKKYRKEEKKLQVEIVKLLRMKGHFFFSVPNERIIDDQADLIMLMELKRMGLHKGAHDIFIATPPPRVPGNKASIEVKWMDNEPDEDQKRFACQMVKTGGRSAFVWTLPEAINILEFWGYL